MSNEPNVNRERHNALPGRPTVPGQPEIRLPLGHLKATQNALAFMKEAGINPATLLQRHHKGDWGDLCKEDWLSNDDSLLHGGRNVSCYRINQYDSIWIITEANRSETTILLPDDY